MPRTGKSIETENKSVVAWHEARVGVWRQQAPDTRGSQGFFGEC